MPTTTTPTTPTTLLDAINQLLLAIRVAPISTFAQTESNTDAGEAKKALDQASIEVQTRGWEFNTEREKVIDPEVDGRVLLPSNTLRVRSARLRSTGDRLVWRPPYLYNPKAGENTYTISESVEVDIVVALEFSQLTPTARFYVTGMAARQWCPAKMPVGATFRWTEELMARTLADMENEDAELIEMDLKQTSPHFANMGRR